MWVGTLPLSNCATVTPLAIDAAVVLFAPLVHPVNVVLEPIAVYEICSLPIDNVPALSKSVVLATVIVVTLSVCVVLVVVVLISSSCSTALLM